MNDRSVPTGSRIAALDEPAAPRIPHPHPGHRNQPRSCDRANWTFSSSALFARHASTTARRARANTISAQAPSKPPALGHSDEGEAEPPASRPPVLTPRRPPERRPNS